jgi:hypothetical protein
MSVKFASFEDEGNTAETSTKLNQLIDVIQEDISGSVTRKKYQVFVTGGIGPGVTSSLFQTVFDQDFSLQTANPIMDMTLGLFFDQTAFSTNQHSTHPNGTPTNTPAMDVCTSVNTNNRPLFLSSSLMMREKIDIYRQHAKALLGDANAGFYLGDTKFPSNDLKTSYVTSDINDASGLIGSALFLDIKRLFARDAIRKETFAMRVYSSASSATGSATNIDVPNIGVKGECTSSITGNRIVADISATSNLRLANAGDCAQLKFADDTSVTAGLIFYDAGVAVLDMKKVFDKDQFMLGVIDGMNNTTYTGEKNVGSVVAGEIAIGEPAGGGNVSAKFIPDFVCSASIDNVVDHIATSRFQSGSLTATAFQNQTNIESRIYFCNAEADQFNFSSNPTFVDSAGGINTIEESGDSAFVYITGVGLYNENEELLAVGKMSRPLEKDNQTQLTIKVRLDF